MKTFKQWLEGMMGGTTADPEMKSPELMAVAAQAQAAMKNAITKGENPVQAAQKAVANNATRLPIKDIGKIMPTDNTNPLQKRMKKK